jgi:hypothetical protein
MLIGLSARAATLPTQLTPDDISDVVGELGTSGAIRLMRSAEAYPKFWPGAKIGVAFDVLFAAKLAKLGDKTGNVPGFIPQPKFYFSKSLYFGLEFIFSFFPASVMSTLGSTGGLLKWTFFTETQRDLAVAGYAGFTSLTGLNGTFSGTSLEGGVYGSKDFVRLKPYAGIGMQHISGSVPRAYATTDTVGASSFVMHTFAGCEFNLPVNIAVQLDLYNITPRAAMFFGKKF